MHPLFATDPNQMQNQNQNQNGFQDMSSGQQNYSYGAQPPNVPYQGTYMNPSQQKPVGIPPPTLPQQSNNQMFSTTLPNAQPQQVPQQIRPEPVPEQVKQKAPLPEEYMYLQTVFNELRNQCLNTASNPVS